MNCVRIIVGIVFFISGACGLLPLQSAEEGFQPLFNDENLDGWVNVNCAPETWSVRDGMIVCTGFPTGVLRTVKQYENYILELPVRYSSEFLGWYNKW